MSGNIRRTVQREILLEYLRNNHTHPTVEDIYRSVRKKLPHISKKTVYSNLELFCEMGLIREIDVKGVKRYETVREDHHHLLCRGCNNVLDIEVRELTEMARDIAARFEDFDVFSTTTYFYGVCRKCRGS